MKRIIKSGEPNELSNWRNLRIGASQGLNYADIDHNTKNAIKRSLLNEQGHICCYCEMELEENNHHIEHLKPQSQFQNLATNYANMLCSCQINKQGKQTPNHCGISKDNWYEEGLFVSPLDQDCEARFKYSENGKILPSVENDKAAHITIEILNLNNPAIINLRKAVIDAFNEAPLSGKDFERFVNGYLADINKENPKFKPFYTTIQFLYKVRI